MKRWRRRTGEKPTESLREVLTDTQSPAASLCLFMLRHHTLVFTFIILTLLLYKKHVSSKEVRHFTAGGFYCRTFNRLSSCFHCILQTGSSPTDALVVFSLYKLLRNRTQTRSSHSSSWRAENSGNKIRTADNRDMIGSVPAGTLKLYDHCQYHTAPTRSGPPDTQYKQ